MITDIKTFKEFIKTDFASQRRTSFVKDFVFSPVWRFCVLLRLNEYLVNTKKNILIRVVPLLWFRRLSVRLGFSIPFNVFDKGLAIVHYGLLIVNPDARIGENCRIHAGVNIGGQAGFKAEGDTSSYAPVIGNNCYIGPGAKLFGAIVIGNNNVIGANAVVNKSFIEEGITIAGVPAKVISQKGSTGKV